MAPWNVDVRLFAFMLFLLYVSVGFDRLSNVQTAARNGLIQLVKRDSQDGQTQGLSSHPKEEAQIGDSLDEDRPLPDMGKVKATFVYLFAVPDFQQGCGTCIVSHYLCHRINTLTNAKAKIISQSPQASSPPKASRSFNTPALANSFVGNELVNAVVVYVQSRYGYNPWNASRFVHWALYWPDRTGLLPSSYPVEGATMCYFGAYCDSVATEHPVMRHWEPLVNPPLLTAVHVPKEMKDAKKGNRNGTVYYHNPKHRYHSKALRIGPQYGSRLPDGLNPYFLAETFNRIKTFYSFDPLSLYNVFAALCGANVIVVPVTGLNADSFRSLSPYYKYGIAYGSEPTEMEQMQKTLALVPQLMDQQTKIQEVQVMRFVAATQEWDKVVKQDFEAQVQVQMEGPEETKKADEHVVVGDNAPQSQTAVSIDEAPPPSQAPTSDDSGSGAEEPHKKRSRHRHGYIKTTRKNFELMKMGKLNPALLGIRGLGGGGGGGVRTYRNKTHSHLSFWDLVKQARDAQEAEGEKVT